MKKIIHIKEFVKMFDRISRRGKDFYVRLDDVKVDVWDYGKDYTETYKLNGSVGLENAQASETPFTVVVYPCDFRNLGEIETFIYLEARNFIDDFEMINFKRV